MKTIVRYALNKDAPRWIVLCIDLYITIITFVLAYIIRYNFNIEIIKFELVINKLPLVFCIYTACYILIGSYKGIIKHTGVFDVVNVTKANFLGSIILLFIAVVFKNKIIALANTIYYSMLVIPYSIIIIHFLLNAFVLVLLRIFYKFIYKKFVLKISSNVRNVLIYGAGTSGVITFDVIKSSGRDNVIVKGFLDDSPTKIGKKINGLEVYNPKDIDDKFLKRKKINEIIISVQNIESKRLREIVDSISVNNVTLNIVPPIERWINGELNVSQIKPLKIEDLLGREVINVNNPVVQKEIEGKTILITGAAGSIGSDIARQIMRYSYKKLILVDMAESPLYDLQQSSKEYKDCNYIVSDIRDKSAMNKIFNEFHPDLVFHAAAYKHVPLMENNPYEAVKINIFGTKTIADLSVKYRVNKFVMVSTDKAVNPTNVMGATKRVAECYVGLLNKKHNTNFIVTRFGNVLGSNGSVIPLFKRQIEKKGPITVTHKDITRYFMTIPEACQLVLEAGAMGNGGEIFVFDMGESVKLFDLAKRMIKLSGLKYPEDIDIKFIGLREGEKLYEELLADGESTIKTYHPKIMIAKEKEAECELKEQLNNLEFIINNNILSEKRNFEIVRTIKNIVPEFISNNSKYEILDNIDLKR